RRTERRLRLRLEKASESPPAGGGVRQRPDRSAEVVDEREEAQPVPELPDPDDAFDLVRDPAIEPFRDLLRIGDLVEEGPRLPEHLPGELLLPAPDRLRELFPGHREELEGSAHFFFPPAASISAGT